VRFIVDGQEVATAVTDERGFAKAIVTLEKPVGRFEANANFGGDEYRSEAEVVAWRNDRVIVACDIDAASYGVHGMLVLLVQPDEDPIRVDNVFRFQTWQQIRDFFRDNRELLEDPKRVQAVARGEETLKLPQTH
jgi:hypothetical protein